MYCMLLLNFLASFLLSSSCMYIQGSGRGGQGGHCLPQYYSRAPNKIGAMMTECVLLLQNAFDAFRNARLRMQIIVAPPNCVTCARMYVV